MEVATIVKGLFAKELIEAGIGNPCGGNRRFDDIRQGKIKKEISL